MAKQPLTVVWISDFPDRMAARFAATVAGLAEASSRDLGDGPALGI